MTIAKMYDIFIKLGQCEKFIYDSSLNSSYIIMLHDETLKLFLFLQINT